MNIYLISGLGADKRVFSKLGFSTNHVIKHIEWIKPNSNEDLSSYARRLARQIDESKPFFLVGVSFGGMIAVEGYLPCSWYSRPNSAGSFYTTRF
jgi:pimeloyl-ACP methyl ester carboxylesterase